MAATPTSVDAYLADQPQAQRAALQRIRETIHRVLPETGEKISYAIPAVPLGEPIPYDLIAQVAVRLAERERGR